MLKVRATEKQGTVEDDGVHSPSVLAPARCYIVNGEQTSNRLGRNSRSLRQFFQLTVHPSGCSPKSKCEKVYVHTRGRVAWWCCARLDIFHCRHPRLTLQTQGQTNNVAAAASWCDDECWLPRGRLTRLCHRTPTLALSKRVSLASGVCLTRRFRR